MKDKKRWKSLAAWTLALSMVFGNNGTLAMAQSAEEAGEPTQIEEGFVSVGETSDVPENTDAANNMKSVGSAEGFAAENEAANSEEWFAEESDEFVSEDMAELFDDGDDSTEDGTEEPGEDGENNSYTEYRYPSDRAILISHNVWVDKSFEYYMENNGEAKTVLIPITGLEVYNAEDEEDETPVCEREYEDENGWNIQPRRMGHAIVKISYNDYEGNPQEHEFNIWVNGDVYSDDNNTSKYLNIQSNENDGETEIRIKAMLPGEENPVLEENLWVGVYGAYTVLLPVNLDNPSVGEYVDFSGLQVKRVDGEKTEILENVEYRVEHVDSNIWQIEETTENSESEESKLPSLRRIAADGTQITVVAYAPNDENILEEVGRRDYWFDGLDYSVWFENLREEYFTYVFEDESYSLKLNTDALQDKAAKVRWEVGYRIDKEENSELITDSQDFEKFWTEDEKDNSVLNINGEALKKAEAALYEKLGAGMFHFEVNVYVLSQNGDIEVWRNGTDLGSRENVRDYHYPLLGLQLFPGEEYTMEKSFDCYVEDQENPSGDTKPLTIKNVSLETIDSENGEAPVTLREEENGWVFGTNCYGGAKVTVEFTDVDGETSNQYDFEVWVTDQIYYIGDISSPYEHNPSEIHFFNGEEQKIELKIFRQKLNEDGTYTTTEIPSGTYTVNVGDEENPGYDTNLLENVKVEGSSIVARANGKIKDADSIWVNISSNEMNENNEPEWGVDGRVYFAVTDSYYTISSQVEEDWDNFAVGKLLDFNTPAPTVTFTRLDEDENRVTESAENVKCHLEYDTVFWEPTEETKDQSIPVLKRTGTDTTWAVLVAEAPFIDEEGNEIWQEVASHSYRFSPVKETFCEHQWKESERVDATCTKEGTITYICTKCEETKTEVIEKIAHTIVTVRDSEPTCGTAGKQHQECSMCHGQRKNLADLPATGKHKYGAYVTVTEATALKKGKETRTCSVCGASQSRNTAKLNAFIKVSETSFPMKKGQSLELPVTLEKGDSIKSVTSKNTKKLTVSKYSGGIKLKVNKKAGIAKIVVTCGKVSVECKVTVTKK